jgi:ATP-dependent helicase/nuclease subunit A
LHNSLQITTNLQNSASDPSRSVFVSASAGSGKTRVLTNRVLRLLLNGTPPSKILCLTFTKVAAALMQKRIFAELQDWLILSDENLQKRLTELTGQVPSNSKIKEARKLFVKLLDDNSGLQIFTIHAFCQSIIKKFPVEAKISPNFEIIDEQKESELLLQARKELLKLAIDNQIISDQINLISSKLNQDNFLDITSELIQKRQILSHLKEKYFGIHGLTEEIYKQLGLPKIADENTIFADFINDKNWNKNALKELCQNTEIKSKTALMQFISNPVLENLEEYREVFLTAENEPKKQLTTKPIQKQMPEVEELMRLEQKRVLDFFEKLNSTKTAIATSTLLQTVDQVITIYDAIKSQNGYLDYNDLIIKTSQLLENSANREWVRYKLDGIYEHILVDESQDTNHYQWNIVKTITEEFFAGIGSQNGERTIFAVGDEKQSIYSFQGANPDIFANIFYYYQDKLKLINQPILNVELNSSFRSFPVILQAVDAVFSKPEFAKQISSLSQTIKHNAIKTHLPGKVELLPAVILKSEEKLADEYCWNLDFAVKTEHKAQEILAQIIAKKIKNFFAGQKFLAGKNRQLEYRDILILLKERKSPLENSLIKYLQLEQIPVSGRKRIKLNQEIIVQDLLSAARFILLPQDDLNLACLLKSPIIGISEEELLEACELKNHNKLNLFEALQTTKPEAHKILSALVEENQKQQFLAHQFFCDLLIAKNIRKKILERFGNVAGEIIDQFLKLCQDYQHNHFACSIQKFVEFLSSSDLEIKIEDTHHQNQVQISTIHGAKGLEAPIVFLADTLHLVQKQFGNDKSRIIWDQKTDLPFWSLGKNFECKIIGEIKKQNREVIKKEYMRQLYVAMTRAEEELYVCGFQNSEREAANDCWYNIIKEVITPFAVKKECDFNQLLAGKVEENLLKEIQEEYMVMGKDSIAEMAQNVVANEKKEKVEDFSFINSAPTEEDFEEVLYPSKQWEMDEQNQRKFYLGKITHKILEFLPNLKSLKETARELFIKNYLSNKNLNEEERNLILSKINKLMEDQKLAKIIYHPSSKTEAPIIGKIDGKIISGKIDLLLIEENEVLIIDYKTGGKNPKLEEKYHAQMNLYEKILQKIYPQKKINSRIIWME